MNAHYSLYHLDSERGFRGGERQLLYLAAHLRDQGHDNTVVCRRDSPLDRAARQQEFRVITLPFWGECDPLSVWRLIAAVRSSRHAPILHAHTGHTAMLASMAGRLGAHPWVVHRRVDFPLRSSLSRRWKYDGAWSIIAVSDNIKRVLKSDGVDESNVRVVPDCLPVTDEEARSAGLPDGPLRPPENGARSGARRTLAERFGVPAGGVWIGNLAALVPHKDQTTLLRSVPRVLREIPDARFFLIGDGPLAEELRALALELGVADSVTFTGFDPNPKAWLHSLDLYIQSSWGEGMGSVLLEVMACRLPIVATTAGGIPEVVEDGRSALLVEPRSPQALARAIVDSHKEPAAARRRAQAALSDLERFSLARIGGQVADIYHGLRKETSS